MKKQTEQELEPVGELLKRVKRINKFGSEYGVLPSEEVREVCQGMYSLANSLPEIEVPKNQDELLRAEAKRRLSGEASYLEQRLGEGSYTFDDVLNILGIPRSDVDALRPWLEANKEKTQGAVDRLFHSRELEEYKLPLKLDIPNVRRQSEEFAAVNVDRYHNIFGKFLESLTKVGGFLRDIKATVTTENRSYFSTLDRTLAIGLPAICFSKEDGTLDVKERELIRLYGHEGMGHALNQVVTQAGGLPYFSTRDSELTLSTEESVAQFYEDVLLEDLKRSPETQNKLGIEHKFKDIYQEAKDTEQLKDYKRRLDHYGISVIADKSLGKSEDPETVRKKINILSEVALNKVYAANSVHQHRYNVDPDGNLSSTLVAELRYCARPVPRALEEFRKKGISYEGDGRNVIDSTLLNGFWTPAGFVDNARLRAEAEK